MVSARLRNIKGAMKTHKRAPNSEEKRKASWRK